ncbi:hypothetical protein TNCT_287131 [Trichonephila clavata]|uniref:Uncharacterized protein n=1 Tax=Trichonephila clavata TaxID=2740835 RepID=A0A8X6K0V4_TRICU|nr:hypothetical protein TNCT_287131 [Trichonephila clavata]
MNFEDKEIFSILVLPIKIRKDISPIKLRHVHATEREWNPKNSSSMRDFRIIAFKKAAIFNENKCGITSSRIILDISDKNCEGWMTIEKNTPN